MNEEAKRDHVLECLSEAEQQMKWTPSIVSVTFEENCINTEYFRVQYVTTENGNRGVKDFELEHILFEDPKNFWTRIVQEVINRQNRAKDIEMGNIFKECLDTSPGAINEMPSDVSDLEEGTKFDAGKPRLGEMIMDFRKPLLEVIKVWEFGANKYAKSNWKKVENGEERYTNALARHFAAEMDEVVDAETKLHHAIHVAWNALARLYFIIKDGE